MKRSLRLFYVLLLCVSFSFAQKSSHNADGSGNILLDNNKVEVVKYVGKPDNNVCGIGKHHHDAHLTVALTDAKVLITTENGEQNTAEIPAGAAIWFEAGTHSAMNVGDKETKFLLIYLKD